MRDETKNKIVQDRKNGKVYVVLPNGDMEEKGIFVGTVAIHKKSWVSENYDDFQELTEKDLHGYVYFGRTPKIKEKEPKVSKIGWMGTSGTEMSDHDY